MAEAGAATAKFRTKLEQIEKELGCQVEVVYPGLDEAIEKNRLFADWFEPGTVLAKTAKGNSVITYDIVGGLDAILDSPTGEPKKSLSGFIEPFSDEEVAVDNDRDLAALNDGSHKSGCRLMFAGNNKVRVSINNEMVGDIIAEDPSIARCILHKEFITELIDAVAVIDDENEQIAFGFEEAPERPVSDEDVKEEPSMIAPDIPEYEEYMATQEEQKAKESEDALEKAKEAIEADSAATKKNVKKSEKKAEKKPAKERKKAAPAKKNAAAGPVREESVQGGRFDLLPLDLIGRFLSEFEDAEEGDFFEDIERYKQSGFGLFDATVAYAKKCYEDATDAVFRLAELAGEDAAENGEDAWKEKPVRTYINEAVMGYLMLLKEGDGSVWRDKVLWSLVCGTWVAEE